MPATGREIKLDAAKGHQALERVGDAAIVLLNDLPGQRQDVARLDVDERDSGQELPDC
jgi:hypothetical protein